jgi:nitrite reductase/ring-hydroxylating ferredoxin subunit/uncharacterized membrane protein
VPLWAGERWGAESLRGHTLRPPVVPVPAPRRRPEPGLRRLTLQLFHLAGEGYRHGVDIATTIRPQIDRLGQLKALDGVADQLDRLVRPRLSEVPVRNALSGVWLGHRLHPLLTDIAIGSFTSATLVDFVAPRHSKIARRLIAVGLLSAVPTAAAGLSDWLDVYDDGRRIGLVHAVGNSIGLYFYARSWRRRGSGKGRLSALVGMSVLSLSGYLGGHLSYVLGVGVDHTAFEPRIEEWTDVGESSEIVDGGHVVARVAGNEVLLVRDDGQLRALDNHCSHAGWALEPGKFEPGCVTCPMHGSRFDLKDGRVLRGPAASPQRRFQVRELDGRVEVRS